VVDPIVGCNILIMNVAQRFVIGMFVLSIDLNKVFGIGAECQWICGCGVSITAQGEYNYIPSTMLEELSGSSATLTSFSI
jgi:hypothetical protein